MNSSELDCGSSPFANHFKAAVDILPCSTFLTDLEESFIEQVYNDIAWYVRRLPALSAGSRPTVVLFPAVSSRLRYFIHQIVETHFKSLKTFSVGTVERRTVLCPKVMIMGSPQEKMVGSDSKQPRKQPRAVGERALYRPPPARGSGVLQEATIQNVNPVSTESANSTKPALPKTVQQGKPAQALYVPPNRKVADVQKPDLQELDLPPKSKARGNKGKKQKQTPPKNELSLAVEDETNQTPTWHQETTGPSSAPPQTNRKISRTGSIPLTKQAGQSTVDVGDLMESSELAELSNDVPLEELVPSPVAIKSSCDDEDSWDKLYNETGDLLRPEALEELTLAVGSVHIVTPSNPVYASAEGHDEDLSHVLELYDFPPAFKTEDLFNALCATGKQADFSLKWVDDTHALAIYGSPFAAVDALAAAHTVIKMRPLAQATKESRTCARRISTALAPFKPRPATSATMAKRLVSTALGIKNTVSPEQRKMERQLLADAKERKRQAAQQREAAWEGTLAAP